MFPFNQRSLKNFMINVVMLIVRSFEDVLNYQNLVVLKLPKFGCTEGGFPVSLNNINFESKHLKEDKVS